MPTTNSPKQDIVPVRVTPVMRRQIDELVQAGHGSQSDVIRTAVDRMYQQETRIMSDYEVYHWMGAGWYAPRGERNAIMYYWCGDNIHQEPDTYPMGLGTPRWIDAPPSPRIKVEVKFPIT